MAKDENKGELEAKYISNSIFVLVPKKLQKLKKHSTNVFAIIFFAILTIVVIFNITGLLPLSVWGILFRFWPVFVVMAVLQFLARKLNIANLLVTALGIGLVSALIIFSVLSSVDKLNPFLDSINLAVEPIRKIFGIDLGERLTSLHRISEENYTIGQIKSRNIEIKMGSGEFNLTDNTGSDYFISRSNYYKNLGKPDITHELTEGEIQINFETQKGAGALVGGAEDTKYDISVGQTQIPTDIELDVGAGRFLSVFNYLNIKDFSVSVAAGKANLYFNEKSLPSGKINIDVGAGSLTLVLPYNTYARFVYNIGQGRLLINNQGFSKRGVYTTPNFRVISDPLEINVNVTAGTVIVDSSGRN